MVARAEDILRAIIRWYFLEAVCVLCFFVALTSPGFDRLWFGLTGLFTGAAAARMRLDEGSALDQLVRVVQGFVGVGAVLLGTALTGLGGILGWAGSYGILAAIMFIPAGLGLVTMGVGMARLALSEPSQRGSERAQEAWSHTVGQPVIAQPQATLASGVRSLHRPRDPRSTSLTSH